MNRIVFEPTGEMRPVKRGEWFGDSGADSGAFFRWDNELESRVSYPIYRRLPADAEEVVADGEVLNRDGYLINNDQSILCVTMRCAQSPLDVEIGSRVRLVRATDNPVDSFGCELIAETDPVLDKILAALNRLTRVEAMRGANEAVGVCHKVIHTPHEFQAILSETQEPKP